MTYSFFFGNSKQSMDNAESDVDYSALAFETREIGTRRQNRLRDRGLTNFSGELTAVEIRITGTSH